MIIIGFPECKNQDFNADMSLIQQLRNLSTDGTVIVIESKREGHQGRYIDASDTFWGKRACVTAADETELVTDISIKWTLRHIREDIVALESFRYRDHYLDMNPEKHWDRHVQRVTHHHWLPHSSESEIWAQFRVRGSSLDDVAFQSCRWPNRWLDSHEDGRLYGSRSPNQQENDPIFENRDDWARFKISRAPAAALDQIPSTNTGLTYDREIQLTSGTDAFRSIEFLEVRPLGSTVEGNFCANSIMRSHCFFKSTKYSECQCPSHES